MAAQREDDDVTASKPQTQPRFKLVRWGCIVVVLSVIYQVRREWKEVKVSDMNNNNNKPVSRVNVKHSHTLKEYNSNGTNSTSATNGTNNTPTINSVEDSPSSTSTTNTTNGSTATTNSAEENPSSTSTDPSCHNHSIRDFNYYSKRSMILSNVTQEFVSRADLSAAFDNTVKMQEIVHEMDVTAAPTVGEEFVYFSNELFSKSTNIPLVQGTRRPMHILGKKLVKKEPISVLWMGGSNTEGRNHRPFTKQTQELLVTQMGHRTPKYINLGDGGRTSCSFATTFKSSLLQDHLVGMDLVFLEFAVNDGVLTLEQRRACLESLIRRIWAVRPEAAIVAVSLRFQEGHDEIIQYYNLPHIFLGSVTDEFPILKKDKVHLSVSGCFLVRQAVAVLAQQLQSLYCITSPAVKNDGSTANNTLPPRLFEPAENFDWKFAIGLRRQTFIVDRAHEFRAACSTLVRMNGTTEANSIHHQEKCSNAIIKRLSTAKVSGTSSNISIPCTNCADTSMQKVYDVGAGWILCRSGWPKICKPQGVHHHHCCFGNSEQDHTGMLLETYEMDNRATLDRPASMGRRVNVTLRLLKGYDIDFGQAIVMVWVKEVEAATHATHKSATNAAAKVVGFIDTKWNVKATVLADVTLQPPLFVPPPAQHNKVTVAIAIIPIQLDATSSERGKQNTNTTPLCRLYFNELLAQFL